MCVSVCVCVRVRECVCITVVLGCIGQCGLITPLPVYWVARVCGWVGACMDKCTASACMYEGEWVADTQTRVCCENLFLYLNTKGLKEKMC